MAKCFGDIEPRRNHIAAVAGRYLIIHGGINSQGTYLSDVVALNFCNETLY